MKLVFAIINSDDEKRLLDSLNANKFSVTKLCSSGGFLKTGNTTIMSAIEDQRANLLIDLIKRNCRNRKQMLEASAISRPSDEYSPMSLNTSSRVDYISPYAKDGEGLEPYNIEVVVGGAIIFVIKVEQFVKL